MFVSRADGTDEIQAPTGGRNTEVLAFRGDEICRAEVYFGWKVC